jgi:restriction system protein
VSDLSNFWTIRTGKHGERTEWAFANGLVGGGWQEFSDLSPYKEDREKLRNLVSQVLGGSKGRVANYTGQLWMMINRIHVGDYVVLPIRSTSQIAIGQITQGYKYVSSEEDPSRRHQLGVNWIRTDIPKSLIKQDLLFQLGSALTVFLIGNNDAGYRLEQLLNGKPDPGSRGALNRETTSHAGVPPQDADSLEENLESLDLEQIAQDEISRRLQEDFKGHELSVLVEALLSAEGFKCRNSPPGADGGVDVLAGMGPLGMDSPKLVVQVKSQTSSVSDVVLQQLNGAIHRYHADQGLLVTFGGVTGPARAYLESQYFNIRVWTMDDIIESIYNHYEMLGDEIRAKLSLKRIWIPISDS